MYLFETSDQYRATANKKTANNMSDGEPQKVPLFVVSDTDGNVWDADTNKEALLERLFKRVAKQQKEQGLLPPTSIKLRKGDGPNKLAIVDMVDGNGEDDSTEYNVSTL